MKQMFDKELPDSIRMGQRLTGMTSGQDRFPIAPSVFEFAQYGQGVYVYSAYSWYRQLPHGVPGAFRIMANLLSLPETVK